jgi:phosphoribosylanthranilate isomerase
VHALPAVGCNVALFVNETKERVHQVLSSGVLEDGRQGYQAVQFHGDENEGYCRDWDLRVIKAFRLKDRDSARQVDDFPADYYLLDSWSAGYGGSGASFPWEWLDGLNPEKIILSGGLNLRNIAEAVRRIRPYGVDVCSGVEVRPGVKDHEKIKEFILAAKGA